MVVLAAEEHPLPGHEDIVEDEVGVCVSAHKSFLIILPSAEVVDGQDLLDTLVICRDSEGHGILLLVRAERPGGNDHDLVCNGCLGYVQLASPHHDAVALFFHHVQVHVRVCLLDRPFQPLALDVGLGACANQVASLEVFEPLQKILVIFGVAAVGSVGLE